MINSKKELDFYIKADLIMNRGYFSVPLKQRIQNLLAPDYIMDFLKCMRKVSYYSHTRGGGIKLIINKLKYRQLSIRLGFSIGSDVFGYGLIIPHYGTIVAGNSSRAGNYCVLHTSTCISDDGKIIGNAMYLSTGAKITSKITLGDNISIGANSLVNKSFPDGNALLVGMPAIKKCERDAWYVAENGEHKKRVESIEQLKRKMGL